MIDVETSNSDAWLLCLSEMTEELTPLYDTHHVCAAVGELAARHIASTVVVAATSYSDAHYYLWLVTGEGVLEQVRREIPSALLDALAPSQQPELRQRNEISADLLPLLPFADRLERQFICLDLRRHGSREADLPGAFLMLFDPPVQGTPRADRLNQFADLAGGYLSRARLMQQVNRQQIMFDTVQHVGHLLSSKLSLEEIFATIADPIIQMLDVETVSIGLVESETGDIVFVNELMEDQFRRNPLRLRAGQGIAGWVAEHGKMVVSNDVYTDPRFYAQVDKDSGFRTRSILCVPLTVERQVVGIIQAINKRSGLFNQQDLYVMQGIANPLSVALENARLHGQVLAEKQRIETLFANMSEGILAVDGHGIITGANDAMGSLLKRPHLEAAGSLLGGRVIDVMHTHPKPFDLFLEQVAVSGDTPPHMTCDLTTATGDALPVLISGAPIYAEDDQVREMIFVISDLSPVREVERMRDDFFHNIVHELRTPVATILMYARLLQGGEVEPQKAAHYLSMLESTSDSLQQMVRDMLQVAKLEARQLHRTAARVDVNQMLSELLVLPASRAADKGVAFEVDVEPNLPSLSADSQVLHSIFKNVVENAVKFTDDGRIVVRAWSEDDALLFQVEDDGIGIPDHALPQIFGRFFRAGRAVERSVAGSGLGLYMVKQGVEMHQGEIDVTSSEGAGTTFTIRLPVQPSDASVGPPRAGSRVPMRVTS